MSNTLKNAFLTAQTVLNDFCQNEENFKLIETIAAEFATAFKYKNKLLICGNGGSNCDAMHFAEEFTGQFRKKRKALPVISLSDSSHITCVGNDYGFEYIFSRGVEALGQTGDWLICLSTSGNSANIIQAVQQAKLMNIKTFALLGKEGGKLKGVCDYELIIKAQTSDRVQELHMLILHVLIEGVERILFPENYIN